MKLKMIYKKLIFALLYFILASCGNQFTCGYDPESYKLVEIFSIKKEFLKTDLEKIASTINQYGVENQYCLANGSREQSSMNRFLINIQIIKNDFAFYAYGTDEIIFNLEAKEDFEVNKSEIESFCDLIEPYVDVDKVRYYEGKGKMCTFN